MAAGLWGLLGTDFPRCSPAYPSVRTLRSLTGPFLLALAVWCAAGAVALPAANDPTTRLIVIAPLWVAAVGGLGGWLLPGCRRRPLTVSPAVLTIVPWLPVSLPAIFQIWTGRLAWVPVAVAILAALLSERVGPQAPAAVLSGRRLGVSIGLAALVTLLVLLASAWALEKRLPGGDEPYYMVITQSLLKDGDLRIENNYQARDYASFFRPTLSPDFIRRGRDEVIYSIHGPGLPMLIAPLFAVFGYRGAQATVMGLAVLTGALTWLAGWRATNSRGAAWFALTALVSSITFLMQGVSIFPDGPGAAVVAVSVLVLLAFERGASVRTGTLVGLSASLSALPFLHTRLVMVSVGVAVAVLWQLMTEPGTSRGRRRSRALAFVALPMLGAIAWLGYFEVLYGTLNPSAPYGAHPETRVAYIPGGVLALLFDQQFGLLAFSPVFGAAVVGWLRRDKTARPILVAVGLYLAAVGTYWMWWAGLPATPARFSAAILPALAPALAVAWSRSRATGRVVLLSLLLATAFISVAAIGITRGDLAWNHYTAHALWLGWLGTSVDLARALPSFFWNLDPGVVSSEWPFVAHVAALILAIIVVASVAGAVLRWGSERAVTGAWAMVVGVMLIAQMGWWHNGTAALEPTGSQLGVLRSLAGGHTGVLVKSSGLSRGVRSDSLAIEAPRDGLANERKVAWADLVDLPAGDYDLTVVLRRATGGTLTVRVGDESQPRPFVLDHRTEQTFRLTVPMARSSLDFEADATLASSGQRLVLRPVSLRPASR